MAIVLAAKLNPDEDMAPPVLVDDGTATAAVAIPVDADANVGAWSAIMVVVPVSVDFDDAIIMDNE